MVAASTDFYTSTLKLASASFGFHRWLKARPELARTAIRDRDSVVLLYLRDQAAVRARQSDPYRLPFSATPSPPVDGVLPFGATALSIGPGNGDLPDAFDFSPTGNAIRCRVYVDSLIITQMEIYFENLTDDVDAYRLLPTSTPGSTDPNDYVTVSNPDTGLAFEFDSVSGATVALYTSQYVDYAVHHRGLAAAASCTFRGVYV